MWLVPWGYLLMKLGGRPVVRQHMTVMERDGWYWEVTVVDFGVMMRTNVNAQPNGDAERAARQVERAYETLANFEIPDTMGGRPTARPVLHRSDAVPRWAKISLGDPTPFRVPWKPEAFTYSTSETAIGWPLRAFRGERVYAGILPPLVDDGQPRGGIQRRDTTRGFVELGALGLVPYLPIWRGLVLDILVFMLPWSLLLWGAGLARRRRRLRRGRCGGCGYDLAGIDRGTACPECGALGHQ